MAVKTVVVTRPLSDAAQLMQALQSAGHHAICEPLTEIFLNHTARLALEKTLLCEPDAILVTSRNGVAALAALCELRDHMILCVGESTAASAQSAGFSRVCTCGETVLDMVNYITDAYEPDARFVYISAEHVRSEFSEYGLQVERIIAYSAIAAEHLSDTLIQQIKRGQIDVITFMSQRSAEIFMTLARHSDIVDSLSTIDACCMSATVAKPLQNAVWKHIIIASKPTLASVVQSVDNA